jgi:hypothetical protein
MNTESSTAATSSVVHSFPAITKQSTFSYKPVSQYLNTPTTSATSSGLSVTSTDVNGTINIDDSCLKSDDTTACSPWLEGKTNHQLH